ncbi:YegP family protein [Arthrobacter sp. 135MFCol5.1]|uniref:YegP family protein n=1 Tax=Arthrobacter sp. 135MFCol5.1 TaxID=1158050 RepID=UPI002F2B561C
MALVFGALPWALPGSRNRPTGTLGPKRGPCPLEWWSGPEHRCGCTSARIRFRLVMPDGHVLAVSGPFTNKRSAAAAIEEVRECAGTGLIRDVVPPAGLVLAPAAHTRCSIRRGIGRLGALGVA